MTVSKRLRLALFVFIAAFSEAFSYLIVECRGDYNKTFNMFRDSSSTDKLYANIPKELVGYLYHQQEINTSINTNDCSSYTISPPLITRKDAASILLLGNYSSCMLERIEMARAVGYDAILSYTINDTNRTITNSIALKGFPIGMIEYSTVHTFTTRVAVPITNHTLVKITLSSAPINIVLPAVASTVSLLLCLFLSFCIYRNVRSFKRRSKLNSLADKLVIPTRKYGEGRQEKHTACNICLEDFKTGTNIRQLPCEHIFHPSCIDEWLSRHSCVCPNCKMNLRRHYYGSTYSKNN